MLGRALLRRNAGAVQHFRGLAATPASSLAGLVDKIKTDALSGLKDDDALTQVASQVKTGKSLESLSSTQIVDLAWSCATLSFDDREMYFAIASKFPLANATSHQEVSNLVWSFSCANVLKNPVVRQFMNQSLPPSLQSTKPLTRTQALPLYYCCVDWIQSMPNAQYPRLLENLTNMDLSIVANGEESVVPQTKTKITQLLKRMGLFQLEANHTLPNGIVADALISEKACMLIDDRDDLLADGTTQTGATKLKSRLITEAGFQVFHVNMASFEAVEPGAQRQFLADVLFPPPPPK